MFTPTEREQLREELIRAARDDKRIAAAALTGSAAAGSAAGGRMDRWSDIDLAFGLALRPT